MLALGVFRIPPAREELARAAVRRDDTVRGIGCRGRSRAAVTDRVGGVAAGTGDVEDLLRRLDVDSTADQLRAAVIVETSQHRKKMLLKRLKIVDAFRNSGDSGDVRNKPE